ncbi:MAG: hypothetical protein ACR2NH_02280 [Solirubrobacteraceae bacterium]
MAALVAVLAHAGHWVEGIAFATPAILLPLGLLALVRFERRRGGSR